jgi:predicted lipoprotein with Yx(FWY)xxD motif
MPSRVFPGGPRRHSVRRTAATALAALTAFAAVAAFAVAGIAVAKSLVLQVAKNATVTDMTTNVTEHEAIAINAKGFAVYWLSGDSKTHPKCTQANGCFKFWPPVTVKSAKSLSKAAGISGKLSTWSRDGFKQVVLGGHPLYTFAPDTKKDDSTGQGVVGFGGTWHVVTASGGSQPASQPSSGTQTTSQPPAMMNPNPYMY